MKTSILISMCCLAGILVSCGKKPAETALPAASEQMESVPETEAVEEMPMSTDSLQLEQEPASIEL
ncbi:hypothetical protein [Cyclobacterium xiamenense]|uniref:hypothetical protein n=1 Tax=Cyclobacterium xiamenense TaxID=1297121 RepID=UPI0035D0B939